MVRLANKKLRTHLGQRERRRDGGPVLRWTEGFQWCFLQRFQKLHQSLRMIRSFQIRNCQLQGYRFRDLQLQEDHCFLKMMGNCNRLELQGGQLQQLRKQEPAEHVKQTHFNFPNFSSNSTSRFKTDCFQSRT